MWLEISWFSLDAGFFAVRFHCGLSAGFPIDCNLGNSTIIKFCISVLYRASPRTVPLKIKMQKIMSSAVNKLKTHVSFSFYLGYMLGVYL